jgi:DNA-binding MarR family transcriptional regulator
MSITISAELKNPRGAPEFSFLTNHGKTLLLIAQDPRIRMRDIADLLGITERATQRIVADLARAGYIDRERDGRRNRYSVKTDAPLGLPLQRDIDIGALLAVLFAQDAGGGG